MSSVAEERAELKARQLATKWHFSFHDKVSKSFNNYAPPFLYQQNQDKKAIYSECGYGIFR